MDEAIRNWLFDAVCSEKRLGSVASHSSTSHAVSDSPCDCRVQLHSVAFKVVGFTNSCSTAVDNRPTILRSIIVTSIIHHSKCCFLTY